MADSRVQRNPGMLMYRLMTVCDMHGLTLRSEREASLSDEIGQFRHQLGLLFLMQRHGEDRNRIVALAPRPERRIEPFSDEIALQRLEFFDRSDTSLLPNSATA